MTPERPLAEEKKAIRIINALAPVRICDPGGWTDTWFAEYGEILNFAIYPGAEVQIEIFENEANPFQENQDDNVTLKVEDFNDLTYKVKRGEKGEHPMLEAVINSFDVPKNLAIKVTVHSDMPYGSSTGTSAAVCVALIAGMAKLCGEELTKEELVERALNIERGQGRQSGIQDQICSAWGGINYIVMDSYPKSYSVTQLNLPEVTLLELQGRFVLVTLGKHNSSGVHSTVIERNNSLDDIGKKALFDPFRESAREGKDALLRGSLVDFGKTLIKNTEAQRNLHPDLISKRAKRLIEIAQKFGALGWKVNGAGGEGGSITILGSPVKREIRKMIEAMTEENADNPDFKVIILTLSPSGVKTWDSPLEK